MIRHIAIRHHIWAGPDTRADARSYSSALLRDQDDRRRNDREGIRKLGC